MLMRALWLEFLSALPTVVHWQRFAHRHTRALRIVGLASFVALNSSCSILGYPQTQAPNSAADMSNR